MGFYKYDADADEVIGGGDAVYTPTTTLLAADKDTYTYPVEGWYWFETKREAKGLATPDQLSRFQLLAALSSLGELANAETYIAGAPLIEQQAWEHSRTINKTDTFLTNMATANTWDSAFMDNLFAVGNGISA